MANTLAYGFLDYAQLVKERLTTIGEEAVYRAVQDSANEHTRQINALLDSMVLRTTLHKVRYKLPGSGTLQPLDDNGNPIPVREEGYYDVAFPIQGGGTAWGDNRVARALMTIEEANRQTTEAMKRDSDWMRRHVLAALFDNVAWTYTDSLYGSLTVEPLANSDSVVYVTKGGSTAADNHYLAQTPSIDDDNNPFDDIYDELIEHVGNEPPVVVYVPTNLKASIKTLTNFIEVADVDVLKGSASDRLANEIGIALGDEILGKTDKVWLVEWRALPSSYMIAHAVGGGPVVYQREHESDTLQGFFAEQADPDGNRREYRMLRYCGFGVYNRVGAVAYYVGGSYSIPSGYDAPLAV